MIEIRIAITSTGKDLESNVHNLFGRCPYFIIVEIKDKKIGEFETIENISANQMGGAGISAAQIVAEKDISAVITQNIGPRALDVLKQFDIEIYVGEGSIKEVLQKLIDKKLKKLSD